MPFCTQCGHENPEDSRFCGNCGHALVSVDATALPPDATSTISLKHIDADQEDSAHGQEQEDGLEALPAGSALLVVRRGPNAGNRYVINSDVTTVGRHPDSDIFLDDVTVSRRHAEFVRDGQTISVRDVGSLNGTYVDRERIDTANLSSGDEVQIGKYRLVFMTHVPSGTTPEES